MFSSSEPDPGSVAAALTRLPAALGRSKTPRFTIRNWRTVAKLVDMVNDVG